MNCFLKQFAICLGVFVIECDEIIKCGWRCYIDHVWCSKEYVCCACGLSERLDAPSISVFLYVGSYLLI